MIVNKYQNGNGGGGSASGGTADYAYSAQTAEYSELSDNTNLLLAQNEEPQAGDLDLVTFNQSATEWSEGEPVPEGISRFSKRNASRDSVRDGGSGVWYLSFDGQEAAENGFITAEVWYPIAEFYGGKIIYILYSEYDPNFTTPYMQIINNDNFVLDPRGVYNTDNGQEYEFNFGGGYKFHYQYDSDNGYDMFWGTYNDVIDASLIKPLNIGRFGPHTYNEEEERWEKIATENYVDAQIDAIGAGPQGPQGATGAQGPQGPQGADGQDGINQDPTVLKAVSELPESADLGDVVSLVESTNVSFGEWRDNETYAANAYDFIFDPREYGEDMQGLECNILQFMGYDEDAGEDTYNTLTIYYDENDGWSVRYEDGIEKNDDSFPLLAMSAPEASETSHNIMVSVGDSEIEYIQIDIIYDDNSDIYKITVLADAEEGSDPLPYDYAFNDSASLSSVSVKQFDGEDWVDIGSGEGTEGPQGADGAQGPQGPAGPQGQNGINQNPTILKSVENTPSVASYGDIVAVGKEARDIDFSGPWTNTGEVTATWARYGSNNPQAIRFSVASESFSFNFGYACQDWNDARGIEISLGTLDVPDQWGYWEQTGENEFSLVASNWMEKTGGATVKAYYDGEGYLYIYSTDITKIWPYKIETPSDNNHEIYTGEVTLPQEGNIGLYQYDGDNWNEFVGVQGPQGPAGENPTGAVTSTSITSIVKITESGYQGLVSGNQVSQTTFYVVVPDPAPARRTLVITNIPDVVTEGGVSRMTINDGNYEIFGFSWGYDEGQDAITGPSFDNLGNSATTGVFDSTAMTLTVQADWQDVGDYQIDFWYADSEDNYYDGSETVSWSGGGSSTQTIQFSVSPEEGGDDEGGEDSSSEGSSESSSEGSGVRTLVITQIPDIRDGLDTGWVRISDGSFFSFYWGYNEGESEPSYKFNDIAGSGAIGVFDEENLTLTVQADWVDYDDSDTEIFGEYYLEMNYFNENLNQDYDYYGDQGFYWDEGDYTTQTIVFNTPELSEP